jgi:hypothetical protein
VLKRKSGRSKTAATPWIRSIKPDGSNMMKIRSHALFASATLAAGSAALAIAAEPPLKTLPLQQDIWITGTMQPHAGQLLSGNQTTLRLDFPAISPCDNHVVTAVKLEKAGQAEPLLLLSRRGQRIALRGRVTCSSSGVRFSPMPEPDYVFPIY